METFPSWAVIVGICGGIVTIFGLIKDIISAAKAINAPNVKQDQRITRLEERCDEFDRYFATDKQHITELETALGMMMKVEFALLSHAINGNDSDKLKAVQGEMFEYLSKRGITV